MLRPAVRSVLWAELGDFHEVLLTLKSSHWIYCCFFVPCIYVRQPESYNCLLCVTRWRDFKAIRWLPFTLIPCENSGRNVFRRICKMYLAFFFRRIPKIQKSLVEPVPGRKWFTSWVNDFHFCIDLQTKQIAFQLHSFLQGTTNFFHKGLRKIVMFDIKLFHHTDVDIVRYFLHKGDTQSDWFLGAHAWT